MRLQPQCLRRSGFTLIELLVVMSIIGILTALLLPAVQSSREAARRMHCQHQLRQLALALHNYHDVHRAFPAGSYLQGPSFPIQSGWGWGAMILPLIEQASLYQQIDFHRGTAVASNCSLLDDSIAIWRCPSDSGGDRLKINSLSHAPLEIASGNYCGVEGVLSAMSTSRFGDIVDGTSQTLLLGERVVQPSINGSLPHTSGWFGQIAFADGYEYRSVPHLTALHDFPINGSLTSPLHFSSRHGAASVFALADGSVRMLSDSLDGDIFEALGTTNGGEVISEF